MTSKKLNTFTIGFEDASFDESQYASKVSSILGTDHHTFILKERDALELVEPYMQHFDEPFADSSAIPFMLLSDHARKEVTVALTGDGGDELFLGYGAYTWASRVKKYGWTRSLLPELSIHKVRKTVSMFSKVGDEQVRSHVFSQEQGFFLMKEIEEMTGLSTNFVYRDPNVLQNRTEEEKQAFFDLNYYLKDDLLVKVDRASMKYALECRCPLMDPAVIDFALRLPHEFKIQNGTSKVLLKKLLSKYLPEELVYRKKWGFGIPLSKWLRGELRFLTEHYLDPGVLERAGFADPAIVSELVRHFNNGDDWLYHRVWTLVCLHYWFVRNAD
jgi:asparagine synthase (glutamine-hydrolysing)